MTIYDDYKLGSKGAEPGRTHEKCALGNQAGIEFGEFPTEVQRQIRSQTPVPFQHETVPGPTNGDRQGIYGRLELITLQGTLQARVHSLQAGHRDCRDQADQQQYHQHFKERERSLITAEAGNRCPH